MGKYYNNVEKDGRPRFLSVSKFRLSEFGGSGEQSILLKLPVGWSLRDLACWAYHNFNTRCHHEYDCCGHWYRQMYTYNAKRVKSRTYYVTASSSQNI